MSPRCPRAYGKVLGRLDPTRYFTGDYAAYAFVRSYPILLPSPSPSPSGIIGRVSIIFCIGAYALTYPRFLR